MGIASILLIAYGDPFYENSWVNTSERINFMISQESYFLVKSIELLLNKNLIRSKSFDFKRRSNEVDTVTY